MALGAQAADIRTLFVAHGLKLVGASLVLGMAGAMGLMRLLSMLFFGVGPMDAPSSYRSASARLRCWRRTCRRVAPRESIRSSPYGATPEV
jgi:hypothetical protein